jgi:hypothetical protein
MVGAIENIRKSFCRKLSGIYKPLCIKAPDEQTMGPVATRSGFEKQTCRVENRISDM